MYIPVDEWIPAFLLTLAVEVPIALALLHRSGPGIVRLAGIAAVANLATHPVVWFVLPQLLDVGETSYTIVAEIWAVAIEALVYWLALPGIGVRRIAITATAANAASWLAGRVLGADLGLLFG